MKRLLLLTTLMTLTLSAFGTAAWASAFCGEVRGEAPVCQR